MRSILPVSLGLLMLAPFAARALTTEKKLASPALQLPQLSVPANVPLQKVAELRMLEPRFAPAAVAHGNFIYIIGGSGRNDAPLASVERFDVRTGRSEPFTTLQTPRLWHQAVLVGDKIYVLGGDSLNGISPSWPSPSLHGPVSIDADTDEIGARWAAREWVQFGPTTPYRPFPSSPLLYASAPQPARPGRNPLSSVEIIDLATGATAAGPALPKPRTNFACAAVGRHIFVIGGRTLSAAGPIVSNRVFILDTASATWTEGAPTPHVRSDAAAAVVSGGFILVSGGYRRPFALDAVDVLNPRTGHWTEIAPLTRPTSAHSLVFFGHQLFLFGDYDNPGELIAYDLNRKTSETFTLQYKASRHTAAVVANDQIFVIGGRTNRYQPPTDLIQVFAPVRS
ncbi:Kelch repeat-containing protein [Opitutus terrae]|uniref:Kelch repeat-containing protein n=1 Tax=Opitutus terrae (strain DSM 11246 / JCM 15787 / PB90-1) TaxID=452637 RepID=B1ZSK1_OPITP|nr:kelch repeat-containing protein [Opitutus terrae]ACB73858.1 Kelch repeat-containing protein [Opitutus terrae PB90-1]